MLRSLKGWTVVLALVGVLALIPLSAQAAPAWTVSEQTVVLRLVSLFDHALDHVWDLVSGTWSKDGCDLNPDGCPAP